jgi:hypothetical protein
MSAFSKVNPRLQLAWDASSLKNYQFCPRSYQMQNLEGWQSPGVDLDFGRYIADGFERFQKARLGGKSIDDALLEVVRWALEATYYEAEYCTLGVGCEESGVCYADAHEQPEHCGRQDTQWGGRYETMWKCEGTEPYKNAKGNRAKCPFAHEKFWAPGDPPDICTTCRSGIKTERLYLPGNSAKHRKNLLRALVWYGLDQPDDINDGYRPYVFPDGTMAVELSGRIPLPFKSTHGEAFMLTWNFDYIGQYGSELFITDNKTTRKTLNSQFFQAYNPDTQFDTYSLVGTLAYPGLEIQGTMVDAVQVMVGGIEFGRHPYYKTEEHHEEHLGDLEEWIRDAERSAEAGYWRMNKRNCWLCPFKEVCSLAPSQREGFLKSNFTKQPVWDPLKVRN